MVNGGGSTAAAPERVLGWSDVVRSTFELFRLSFGIALRRKLPFMIGGVVVFYGLLYAMLVFDPGDGVTLDAALGIFVDFPGAVIGIYLMMDIVARERDRATLETLFSTASSHYAIWTVRLLCVYSVLLATVVVLNAAAYFLFAEVPLYLGGLNGFVPAFLYANVTFAVAVRARGANTAAMVSAAILTFTLMLGEELSTSRFWPFFNPFVVPVGGNEYLWLERIFLNRAGYLAVGLLLAYLALRRMEQREKFLG